MKKPIYVPPTVKASEGRAFVFGRTSIYVGPRDHEANGRNLKLPPVLAYSRPGDDTPHVVGEFPNSAAAEQFIQALSVGIDEMNGQRNAQLAPPSTAEQCGDMHDVHTPFGIFPAVCDLEPPHENTDHAGTMDLPTELVPANFPRRATWVRA